MSRTLPVRQLPEPGRFWIGMAPRSWRGCGGLWTYLAAARLGVGEAGPGQIIPEIKAEGRDELFYIPPVAPRLVAERHRLVERLSASGTPVLLQLLPGEAALTGPATLVYDLLIPLLEGRLEALTELPAGSGAVWPLIAGLTDQPELGQEGCELLAAAGVGFVQPLTLELTPILRRRLAEGQSDRVYDALFHGPPPAERALARVAASHGLETFMPRPDTGQSQRQTANRKIAAELSLIAELWSRLERPLGRGQAIFRAARGAETTRYDLAAVAREENLEVLDWLDAELAELVDEIVHRGKSEIQAELLDEYLGRG